MKMGNKLFTGGKLLTYAIKFDVNKAAREVECTGFLNELREWAIEQ